ncbi:uncharacterized protein Z518_11211 [Rhinocladiella mackenziei CBS 650.93]|uniref:Rhinocladiella mackenziei CBS 650.93 unplaced genomic scaffold supercont1.12, whole genome shotgun sequence n=1 Tax=Rhinocladiella mackenziei CBS 650.93 TaxID=1442369 RepID=A0A0D2GM71_9EURO|nr:uncharacterized protein Z518_11211 [Rhinocladiella mackenziei CBS 650.93]KIW99472.1 hypothetical protein Z518_11211 [Rhinocladiella mackenziei CBS 650.93]
MGVDMNDHCNTTETTRRSKAAVRTWSKESSPSSWWSLPQPIRRVFDRFPLVTYPANGLPQRAPKQQNETILYIFQSDEPRSRDAPSFNPSCLKWQAYLKFHGIPLRTRASNNHASPTGSLPFLLPAPQDSLRPAAPIPANRIARWVVLQGGKEEDTHPRQETYTALIDHTIRSAWLYYLYLDEDNFRSVAWPMYVASASTSYAVRMSLAYQLRNAAREELLKTSAIIDGQELYRKAADAFQSLSTLLAENKFFFGQTTPGLFDASLFAYTQIVLDENLEWKTPTLKEALQMHENLVQHRARLMRGFFSS